MNGVCEDNDADIIDRVNHNAGTRVTGMEISFRSQHVAGRIAQAVVPTQRAAQRQFVFGHGTQQFGRKRSENALAIPRSAVLKHGTEGGNVVCRGEESGIAADTSVHDACKRVVHLATQHLAVLLYLGGRNRSPVQIAGIGSVHPIALVVEPAGLGKVPQALARDILDDILQGNEVQATVLRFCAGLKVTSALRNLIDEGFRIGTAEFTGVDARK